MALNEALNEALTAARSERCAAQATGFDKTPDRCQPDARGRADDHGDSAIRGI